MKAIHAITGRHIEETGERYAVEWEYRELHKMSNMLRDILLREVPSQLLVKILELTVLTSVVAAITVCKVL
jgi:hypothetical protein